MFHLIFKKSNLTGVTDEEWQYIEKIISEPIALQVFECDIPGKTMMALGITLQEAGYGILRWHVYHTCHEDPVEIRDFEEGFVLKPCSVCNVPLDDEVATYKLELIIKYPLKLD